MKEAGPTKEIQREREREIFGILGQRRGEADVDARQAHGETFPPFSCTQLSHASFSLRPYINTPPQSLHFSLFIPNQPSSKTSLVRLQIFFFWVVETVWWLRKRKKVWRKLLTFGRWDHNQCWISLFFSYLVMMFFVLINGSIFHVVYCMRIVQSTIFWSKVLCVVIRACFRICWNLILSGKVQRFSYFLV